MTKKPPFHDQPAYVRLILFGIILMGCYSLFSVLSLFAVSHLFHGIRLNDSGLPIPFKGSEAGIAAFRVVQALNTTGLFLLPPLLLARFTDPRPSAMLGLKGKLPAKPLLYSMLLVVAAVPLINWMSEVNTEMHLPPFLSETEQWMRVRENSANFLTETFMNVTSVSALFANLLVAALIPGIAEELFFRGVLQPYFAGAKNRNHRAVWLTAFIFAALHMQFFTFFPRFFLGAFLGYLYVYTQRLWVPILVHIFNNAFAVVLTFISFNYFAPGQLDKAGCRSSEWGLTALSTLLVGLLLWKIFRKKEAVAV